GDRGKNADKQENQHDEHTDGADVGGPIPEGRAVAAPGRGHEVARQADNHDDEPLEPHADVHDDGHDEEDHDVVADLVKPQQLGRQDVAQNQRVVERCIRALKTLLDEKNVKLVSTVKRKEKLEEVAVSNDEAGGQHDLGHVVQMAHGDVVLEAIRLAQGNRDGDDHGKAGIDGSRHEIGGKDRGVPAGNNGDGKVEADHRMYAEHERCR